MSTRIIVTAVLFFISAMGIVPSAHADLREGVNAIVDAVYPNDGSVFYAEGTLYVVPANTEGQKVSISGPINTQYLEVHNMVLRINSDTVDQDGGSGLNP